MTGRPLIGDVPLNQNVTVKLSKDENEELSKIVKAAKVSKSDIIRSAISIIIKHLRDGYATKEEVKKLFAQRRFSIEAIEALMEAQKRNLERDLNAMAYQEIRKTFAKKEAKQTDSPSEK